MAVAKPNERRSLGAGIARLERDAARMREIEADLVARRSRLDAQLAQLHDAGATIAELARATHLSRNSVYAWINRYRDRSDG